MQTTRGPYERTHAAENLDSVVLDLEQESVPLVFVPADEEAAYADSIIFGKDGNDESDALTVEIDLYTAIQQRHHLDPETLWIENAGSHIREFIENIDDPGWRKRTLKDAKENYGEEYDDVLDWETYIDQELSFDERLKESGILAFWYIFERGKFGGISSTHNQFKAHAFQGTEQKAGFSTFISDFRVPSHGLVAAIEHPTRLEDKTGKQETYIIETDPGVGQQVPRVEDSKYQNRDPFENNTRFNKEEALYKFTALENAEGDLYDCINISDEVEYNFIEFLQNPETSPAYDHIDPMNAAAYLAEENILNGELEGRMYLETDSVTIRV